MGGGIVRGLSIRRSLHQAAGGLPRPFWFLFAGTFVNRLGSFVLPFLALYLTQERHLSLVQAGAILSLYGAGATAAGPIGGFLADRIGRRATMLFALIAGGACMITLGFVDRVEMLAPAVFVVALVGEMYRPGMLAAMSDLLSGADRVRAMGLIYWVINLGYAIGVALGGLLASQSFRLLFVGDGITTILFGICVAFGVPETRPHAAPHPEGVARPAMWKEFVAPYRDGRFVLLLVLSFFIATVFTQNASSFPLDMAAQGLGKSSMGLVFALNGLLIVFLQPVISPLLAPHNRSRVLAVGTATIGLGFGLHAFCSTTPAFMAAVVVWTFGEMAVLPVAHALVADLAPAALRGRYMGAYSMAFGGAVCAAPAVGTWALQALGRNGLWAGCLAAGLAVAAGHLLLARSLTRLRAERLAAE
ncbi:MAG: MFS transporter [Candidatus Eisenbacteria bacterium]|nr:MFS transporter [Candidatus Eisenbacteria bacterium]